MANTTDTGTLVRRQLNFSSEALGGLSLAVLAGVVLVAGAGEAWPESTPSAAPTRADHRSDPMSHSVRAARTAEPVGKMQQGLVRRQDDCASGVVKDDGSPETAYGWVPTVIDGMYVQEFQVQEFPSRGLENVCVCWLRTREDSEIAFEIVFFANVAGEPAETPYASVPAVASLVPLDLASGGAFYEFDVSGVVIPGETVYIGVRWNPSVDQFFFVCADHSSDTDPVNGFYIDEQADEWGSVLDTPDPIFDGHRAIMVRATALSAADFAVPALGPAGSVALALLLAATGWLVLTRR